VGPAGLLQNSKSNSLEENETGEIIDVSPCLSQPIVSPNAGPIVKNDDSRAHSQSHFSDRTTPAARDRLVHILDTDNGWHPAAKVGCELTGTVRTPIEAFNTLSGVSMPGNAV
jgi:hypothetical protein